jgi:antitoxin (DNA-binding transcriptional repressor) of toxin-antitoxin stability system
MSKSQGVKTAVLKSHLSEYLNKVRKGQEITVLDRNTPIALIIPFPVDQKSQIECTQPEEDPSLLGKIKGKKFGKTKKNSLELLLEDRDSK